jgi:hypothetical protein
VEPDPSSLVLIPTLPPHLQTLVPKSLGPAGQDARSTKLPVSLGPSRSGDQTGHVALANPPPFTMQDSNFLAMVGASLESSKSGPPCLRTKTRAQHAAAALLGSRGRSSLKCVAVSTLQYTMPHIPLQVQDALLLFSLPLSPDPQDSITLASVHLSADPQMQNHRSVLPEEGGKSPQSHQQSICQSSCLLTGGCEQGNKYYPLSQGRPHQGLLWVGSGARWRQ